MLKAVKASGVTSTYAGGGTSTTFTVAGADTGDVLISQIKTSTNSVSLTKATVSSANTITATFSADPGAGTVLNYVLLQTL